eukprot:TRINITY_DN14919_c0_g2_i5.p3 TRINITY_DN14919_c0_g2~~TRINITY_DN14919_c0_g2_i5.p3  ORF type:complete len:109 (+),score=10.94 TRINITY_DN14919_c0_g2_i5:469-795(+)
MTRAPIVCQDGLSCVSNKCVDVLIYTDCEGAPDRCGRYFDCMKLTHLPDKDAVEGGSTTTKSVEAGLWGLLGWNSQGGQRGGGKKKLDCAGKVRKKERRFGKKEMTDK